VAQVNIEQIVDHLSAEMRRALEAAVQETAPDADVDAHDLLRAFRRAVGRYFKIWETVPGRCVRSRSD
jgi:hypothetical protein